VGTGVKETVDQNLLQVGAEEIVGERVPVDIDPLQRADLRN